MEDELLLTKEMAINYNAIHRFHLNTPVVRKSGRRSSTRGNPTKLAKKIRQLEAQGFKCIDCPHIFKPSKDGVYRTATADHVIPYRYGSSLSYNCEYVCGHCNQKRVDRSLTYKNIARVFGKVFGHDFTFNKDWE